jgi:hypothetical protein
MGIECASDAPPKSNLFHERKSFSCSGFADGAGERKLCIAVDFSNIQDRPSFDSTHALVSWQFQRPFMLRESSSRSFLSGWHHHTGSAKLTD